MRSYHVVCVGNRWAVVERDETVLTPSYSNHETANEEAAWLMQCHLAGTTLVPAGEKKL